MRYRLQAQFSQFATVISNIPDGIIRQPHAVPSVGGAQLQHNQVVFPLIYHGNEVFIMNLEVYPKLDTS